MQQRDQQEWPPQDTNYERLLALYDRSIGKEGRNDKYFKVTIGIFGTQRHDALPPQEQVELARYLGDDTPGEIISPEDLNASGLTIAKVREMQEGSNPCFVEIPPDRGSLKSGEVRTAAPSPNAAHEIGAKKVEPWQEEVETPSDVPKNGSLPPTPGYERYDFRSFPGTPRSTPRTPAAVAAAMPPPFPAGTYTEGLLFVNDKTKAPKDGHTRHTVVGYGARKKRSVAEREIPDGFPMDAERTGHAMYPRVSGIPICYNANNPTLFCMHDLPKEMLRRDPNDELRIDFAKFPPGYASANPHPNEIERGLAKIGSGIATMAPPARVPKRETSDPAFGPQVPKPRKKARKAQEAPEVQNPLDYVQGIFLEPDQFYPYAAGTSPETIKKNRLPIDMTQAGDLEGINMNHGHIVAGAPVAVTGKPAFYKKNSLRKQIEFMNKYKHGLDNVGHVTLTFNEEGNIQQEAPVQSLPAVTESLKATHLSASSPLGSPVQPQGYFRGYEGATLDVPGRPDFSVPPAFFPAHGYQGIGDPRLPISYDPSGGQVTASGQPAKLPSLAYTTQEGAAPGGHTPLKQKSLGASAVQGAGKLGGLEKPIDDSQGKGRGTGHRGP